MTPTLRNFLRTYPMLLLLLPLVAGIIVCDRTGFPVNLYSHTLLATSDTAAVYRAVLTQYPVEREKTWRHTALLHTGQTVYLYLAKDSLTEQPTAGDTLLVRTRLRRGGMLHGFDYGKYLQRQGIAGSGYARAGDWQVTGYKPMHGPIQWRQALLQRYQKAGVDEKELPVLAALTLGYKEDLDDDTRQRFQRTGAAHILAVSGLHTGLVAQMLLFVLTLGGLRKPLYDERFKRIRNGLILIAGMVVYALLTGLTPSVVRSGIMVSLMALAYMTYRHATGLNTLLAAAFFILVFRPTDLFAVSFQLSFAAVLFILLLEQPLKRLFNRIPDLIIVSIAAQVGVLPLSLLYFGQMSNVFLLTNIVVLPLATLIVYGATALLLLANIPFVGTALAWVETWLLRVMNYYTGWLESMPWAVTERAITPWTAVVLYGQILIANVALRYIAKHKKQIDT